MVTKSLIVVLGLLAMVDRSFALSCQPCSDSECGPPPTNCSFGVAKDVCSCCYDVCAQGPGEPCGGLWAFSGTCGTDLECKNNSRNKPGVCGNKSGLGEQCVKYNSGYGSCKSGLVCKQPCSEMKHDDTSGVCSNKSGPGEQCGSGGGWSMCGECESGLACHRLLQDHGGKPGVCGNKSGPGEECYVGGPLGFPVGFSDTCGTGLECKTDSSDKLGVCGNKSGPGEKCGGPWNEYGTCKSGLVCKQPCSEMHPLDYYTPGVCSNKSGPGEQCGGGWSSRCGECVSGLACHRPLQDSEAKPGVCGNKSGPGEQCGGQYRSRFESTCERGLRCLEPDQDFDDKGRPQPGVCSNRLHSDQTSPSLTTDAPTTDIPTTGEQTTAKPTTSEPKKSAPTTDEPTAGLPSTDVPTAGVPIAGVPTTVEPTTSEPSTVSPATLHRLILT